MATRTKDTVSNILQDVADLRGESSVNTDAARIRAVSRAEQNIALRKFWKWQLVENATTTGDGTNSYAVGSTTFPMREKGLFELYVGGTASSNKYDVLDYEQYKAAYNTNNSDQICYVYYDQTNDAYKVYINPAPAVATTIYYSYYFAPPKRTATSDVVYCPNLDVIVRLASAYVFENEEEQDRADELKAEAEQMISELMGIDNAPGVNQTKAMTSVVSQGFGTY